MRDKEKIYAEIIEEFNIPKPVVRRIARDLRNNYLKKIRILQNGWIQTEKSLQIWSSNFHNKL